VAGREQPGLAAPAKLARSNVVSGDRPTFFLEGSGAEGVGIGGGGVIRGSAPFPRGRRGRSVRKSGERPGCRGQAPTRPSPGRK
jgi:hypothetical protein